MSEEQVVVGSPERDIVVEPLVSLKKVTPRKEDNETEVFKMRCKLYRYFIDEEEGGMWKERGVGDIRILKHNNTGSCRILMRRDKTLKLCANHALTKNMEIKPLESNEKALVWKTPSDYADEESKAETLCIKFGKPESAKEFKQKFEECVQISKNNTVNEAKKNETEKITNELSSLNVKDDQANNNDKKNGESNKGGIKDSIENGLAEHKDDECSQNKKQDLDNKTEKE